MQHTGERPYLCTLCPKMFTRLTYLKEHMNSHTGQKPYLCPHCSETFHERSVFSKHVKRHEAARNVDRNHQQASHVCHLSLMAGIPILYWRSYAAGFLTCRTAPLEQSAPCHTCRRLSEHSFKKQLKTLLFKLAFSL